MKILKNSHGQCHQVHKETIENWSVHIYVKPNHFFHGEKRLRKGILKGKVLQKMKIQRHMLDEI